MTLVLKPQGRGNWRSIVMAIEGLRVEPLFVKVGDRLPLAGIVWRICQVLP